MLFGFIAILMLLLLLGMPVAFALAMVGTMGMVAFLGGLSGLTHIPVIAYKTLDDFAENYKGVSYNEDFKGYGYTYNPQAFC